jgi:hypothetical protein
MNSVHEARLDRTVDIILAFKTCEMFLASGRSLDDCFIDLKSHLHLAPGTADADMTRFRKASHPAADLEVVVNMLTPCTTALRTGHIGKRFGHCGAQKHSIAHIQRGSSARAADSKSVQPLICDLSAVRKCSVAEGL